MQQAPERHIKHLHAQIKVLKRALPEGSECFVGDQKGRLGTLKPYEAAAYTSKRQLSALLLMYTHLVILHSDMSINSDRQYPLEPTIGKEFHTSRIHWCRMSMLIFTI